MIANRFSEATYSTKPGPRLKLLALVGLGFFLVGQDAPPAGDPQLRAELTRCLQAGDPAAAVQHAQNALRARPSDPGVRAEFVALHLALSQEWLAARRYDDAEIALRAVLTVDPQNDAALRAATALETARERADAHLQHVDELLQLELFESALDQLHELAALRPDQAAVLRPRATAARRGAADDHYLARNFPEAFALYESVLAEQPELQADLAARWAVSLALALSEEDFSGPLEPGVADRLRARAAAVLRHTRAPILEALIRGFLAERSGDLLTAGRDYAHATGTTWSVPPIDRRQATVADLRAQAIERARRIYADTPTARRDGFWTVALPEVWKEWRSAHFVVQARNDVVAQRVGIAVQFHLHELADWLAIDLPSTWEPPCEIRVYATQAELHAATNTAGITFAVSHTRTQGSQVLSRSVAVFQADPWLLSATLPHELTHMLIASLCDDAPLPLALEEGLALQAEPPARRLMYRRRLGGPPPGIPDLLATTHLPADVETFYAHAGELGTWLLTRAATSTGDAARAPHALVQVFCGSAPTNWWLRLGLPDQAAAATDWQSWHAARRNPHRMPLMILAQPETDPRDTPGAQP